MAASYVFRLLRSITAGSLTRSHHLLLSSPAAASTSRFLPHTLRVQTMFSSVGAAVSNDDEGGSTDGSGKGSSSSRFPDVEMKKGDWVCSQCNFMNFSRNLLCLQCRSEAPTRGSSGSTEMRIGDWNCPQCKFMNFSRNIRCQQCRTDRAFIVKRGDWTCPKCSFLNFVRNKRCRECDADKSETFDNLLVRQGDWNCPKCQFMNFSRNTICRKCQDPQPKNQLRPGEWECPSCNFLNFRRNTSCLKCNCDHPNDESSQNDGDTWRRVRLATGRSLKTISSDCKTDDITAHLTNSDGENPPCSQGNPTDDDIIAQLSKEGIKSDGRLFDDDILHISKVDLESDDDILQPSKADPESDDEIVRLISKDDPESFDKLSDDEIVQLSEVDHNKSEANRVSSTNTIT